MPFVIILIVVVVSILKSDYLQKKNKNRPELKNPNIDPQSLKTTYGNAKSAPPKPWQTGTSKQKPVLNGKAKRGKAFGQRQKQTRYDSAFENKTAGVGTVAAFGDERDIISSGSMAASNAEYIDVGNDYVKGFDVGGYREPPIGFDR